MSKATRSRDGQLRVTVRVEFRLDLYDLTCAAALAWNYGDTKPNANKIREAVVRHMSGHGEYPGMEYDDQLRDDHDGELEATFEMLEPWVAKTYGFPYKEEK